MKTDLNRMNEVFEVINKSGIKAHCNFCCCQSCGCAAIANEHGRHVPYIFWHEQDHERAFANAIEQESYEDDEDDYGFPQHEYDEDMTGDLWIAHGNLTDNHKDYIVSTLAAAGFTVDWDKSDYTRIKVLNVNA